MMQTTNEMEIPVKYQGIFKKAKASKAAAIKANCISCMGFELAGARDCGCPNCPMFPHNPYRKAVEKRSKN